MEKLDVKQLFELYQDTLEKCGLYLLDEDETTIEYNIYEEFDIGIHSFFYVDNLHLLYSKGYISLDNFNKSILLRNKVIELQNSNEWGIENFKNSNKWKEIMLLSDDIRSNG